MRAVLSLAITALLTGPAAAQAWMCDVTAEGDKALLNIQLVGSDEGPNGTGYVSMLPPESGRLIDWGAEAEFHAKDDGYGIRPAPDAPDSLSFRAWLRNGDVVELYDPYGEVWQGPCEKWDYPE